MSAQPMRARKIRNKDGAVIRVKVQSRQREIAATLAEQAGSRR